MKYFFVLLVLSNATFAKVKLPRLLNCTSKATSEVAREFQLLDLDTTRPGTTIAEGNGGFMGMAVRDGLLTFGFSNECDNDYGITLDLHQIEELQEGKRETITGKLEYMDTYLFEARNEEAGKNEVVEITCRK